MVAAEQTEILRLVKPPLRDCCDVMEMEPTFLKTSSAVGTYERALSSKLTYDFMPDGSRDRLSTLPVVSFGKKATVKTHFGPEPIGPFSLAANQRRLQH